MAKRAIREDVISHERWMVSYADFMTLLLAFFVVMYSVSQLNEDKFRVLTRTLEEAFNVPESAIQPVQVGDPVTAVNPGVVEDTIESPEQKPKSGHIEQEEVKATTSEPQLPEEFKRISREVDQKFSDLMQQGLVSVQGNEEWLEIELKSSLLFEVGDAMPSNDAVPIMDALADTVRGSGLPIRVEGFTDDRPISSAVYPSNWELSSARAASIVKLLAEAGVAPQRMAAIGYGEFQPVASNASEAGRAANRRVVLMISRSARLRPELKPVEEGRTAPQAVPARPAVTELPTASNSVPAVDSKPADTSGMMRIELEGGGVLYTSDPSRARPAGAPAAQPAPPPRNTEQR